ncbi:MAG: ABC transporter ATP-binding protein/permease [Acidimicrobiia bacterium]|nr:ABC transporter ATP-binding protein/permease [Acidimicrobiia bacterium]
MTAVADQTTPEATAAEAPPTGAWVTIRRGLALSPELKVGIGGTLALALIATAGRVVVPVAVQQVIDGGLTTTPATDGGEAVTTVDLGFVVRMVALATLAVFITAGTTALMHLRLARVSETALSQLRIRSFRHIHDLSMLHQASEQRGALVSRVTSDVDEISRFMQWAGLMLLTNSGQALLALVVMLVYSVPLGLVVVATVPLILGTMRWFQSRLDAAFLVVRERVGRMLAVLAEVVVGAPVIRAYGIEERTRRRLANSIEDHRAAAVKAGGLSASFSGVGELLSALVLALVLVIGSGLAVRGSVSVGTVVAFLFLVQLFVQPVQMLGEAVNEAQTAVAGWRRVLDVLAIPPDVADPGPDGLPLPAGPLDISFEGVRFRYPRPGESASNGPMVDGDTLALIDVSLTIPTRTNMAVVGETGSGKTTFAKLLCRLMDPSEGVVRIGGVDVREVTFRSLRDRVVMVPQEGSLFRGSIADNVRMGRPEATDAQVRATFVDLGLDEWLDELERGVDTPVGERGSALSIGERQLVTLVRAAIADPDLLVLDEATSSVDPATEVRISRALGRLTSSRTVVTIAHRLSTAEAADRVLVFDGGRLVEDGPHSELVARGGVYTNLHDAWERGTVAG